MKTKKPELVQRKHDEALAIQLGALLEATGNVAAAIGRAIGWGLGSTNARGESNRECLLRDLDDMKAAIRRIERTLTPTSATLPAQAPIVPAPEVRAADGH